MNTLMKKCVKIMTNEKIGSGFILGSGLLLTCRHCITSIIDNKISKNKIILICNKYFEINPEEIYISNNIKKDFAIIYSSDIKNEPFLGWSYPKIGKKVIVLGYPAKHKNSEYKDAVYIENYICSLDYQNTDLFCVGNNLLPGNSGGPVVDIKGKILGIASHNQVEGFTRILKFSSIINKLKKSNLPKEIEKNLSLVNLI